MSSSSDTKIDLKEKMNETSKLLINETVETNDIESNSDEDEQEENKSSSSLENEEEKEKSFFFIFLKN